MRTLLLTFAFAASTASATLLDSFSIADQPNDVFFSGFDNGGKSFTASYNATCVGGERDLEFFQSQNTALPGPRFMGAWDDFAGGWRFGASGNATPSPTDGYAILQYDGAGDEDGNLGLNRHLRNGGSGNSLFNGADGGIRIWYRQIYDDRGIPITVTLRRLGQVLASVTRTSTDGNNLHFTAFEFSPTDFGLADSLTIRFDIVSVGGNSDQTLNIDRIDTIVPEPGTYLALGGGLAWLVTRRRHQARK